MAVTQIPWEDGSGGNIYLTYPSASGTQTVSVSSDANTRAPRTKVVTFSASGATPVTLTVSQEGGQGTEHTATFNPSFYDTEDYSYYSLSNVSRAYTGSTSNNSCTIALTRGSRAETWIYFGFNVSSIPSDAVIDSVQCAVKSQSGTGNANVVATRTIQMFAGSTEKGSAKTISTSATSQTFSDETWTRSELDNIRIKVYGRRGTSQVNTNHVFEFFGATLTVKYTTYD